jgi:hypothetical protein
MPDEERLLLNSTCPKCGRPATQTVTRSELKAALDGDQVRWYCMDCDHTWPATTEEKQNVSKMLTETEP